ncbi:MAG: molecular chaperone HtpG [Bauldia sp.]
MAETDTTGGETRPFTAEVARLLHLMVHAVYSNRDVFLRELISNGADACEKLRMLALENPDLMAGDQALRIALIPDSVKHTLTIEDNGIGMSREDLVDNLGTIARSGTRSFVEGLAKSESDGNALIGQFGVGFYSAFMVAERVDVYSTPASDRSQHWHWSSDGSGNFSIAPATAGAAIRGTRVVLHLNAESHGYADQAEIERIVEQYSAQIPVPIVLKVSEGSAEKTLADGTALWRKPKAEIAPEQYAEFYGNVSGQFDKPALTLHYRAEGRTEYSVLLFVPSLKPFDLFDPTRRTRTKLYVRRVFITDEAAILPAWLRFTRGVIDSEDLPLNISREMLQKNPVLEQIGRAVTTRLLAEIERLAREDQAAFTALWDAFGPVIKEGLYEDPDRRDALFRIARFKTSAGPGWRSLAEYVAAMRPNQTAVYYALSDTEAAARAMPQIEGFKARGVEVLLLADAVDAFWVRTALGYEGKPFRSVTQGDVDLSLVPRLEAAPEPEAAPESAVAVLAARFKETLGGKVSSVRPSARLAGSAVCLVAADAAADRQFERLVGRHQGAPPRAAPILEINPGHELIRRLAAMAAAGGDAATIEDAAVLLLGQARILDGEPPDEPAEFSQRLDRLLQAQLAR